jgi:hypothetical protein
MNREHRTNKHNQSPSPQASKRTSPVTAIIVLAAVVVVGLGFWWWRANNTGISKPATASGQAGAAAQPATTADKPDFEKLKGRWQRPDGGYVLEVRQVADDGRIDAAYLNPNPINVAKAAASFEAGKMKVYVELQDKGYPGNYYILRYDSGSDQLAGMYYHLGINQQFDVFFDRMK